MYSIGAPAIIDDAGYASTTTHLLIATAYWSLKIGEKAMIGAAHLHPARPFANSPIKKPDKEHR